MKLKAVAAVLALAGFATSVAVAQGPPPGRGPDKGSPAATASATTAAKRVDVCHRTGSAKNPFLTLSVSRAALASHMRHGDLLAPASGGCATRAALPATGKTTP